MANDYHELINVSELRHGSEFVIERARALLRAVETHQDYSVVQLLRRVSEKTGNLECIVVDVEVDGVPPKNRFGICYRERLALCVPENSRKLVEVLALRKEFPVLMHQNQGIRGDAASLCLYFEPPAVVLRTWTPQSFLRRIQWWLEMSAKAELHPTDQPVEQLFFVTKYELVLPWNFDELRKDTAFFLTISRGESRSDGGFTCFVKAIPKSAQSKNPTLTHIELSLTPIIHGFVERDPQTLGELADRLKDRGVDILGSLQTELRQRVDAKGAPESTDGTFVVMLLHIPICRVAGEAPERVAHRAFLISTGAMKLGVAMGVLFNHAHKYFDASGILGTKQPTEWRPVEIFPMEVFRENDPAAARHQSGVSDEGPEGVVVGAGALGGALLNFWGRCGWGRWTVIDHDYIKPHNLSRHMAYSQHIGATKVSVAAELHDAVMQGASQVVPIFGDATDRTQSPVATALSTTKLVIDASTTLEYPRLSSASDVAARHISVFVTPNGNSAVLLAEDEKRVFRLRTLEAQYYRALIQEAWGQQHLAGNPGSFWSGASCRDISTVMPYSRIMIHASTLAEQIPKVTNISSAQIRIWEREPARGGVVVHDVSVFPELRLKLDDLDLFIDGGAEQQLRSLREANLPNETGGVLLGYFDFNINTVVIVAGLPAPSDSESSGIAFQRGIEGLVESVNEASRLTAGIVRYVGEWHSHPRGHSASPSRDDLVQLVQLAIGMADDGLPGVQLIVGENDLSVLQGKVK